MEKSIYYHIHYHCLHGIISHTILSLFANNSSTVISLHIQQKNAERTQGRSFQKTEHFLISFNVWIIHHRLDCHSQLPNNFFLSLIIYIKFLFRQCINLPHQHSPTSRLHAAGVAGTLSCYNIQSHIWSHGVSLTYLSQGHWY